MKKFMLFLCAGALAGCGETHTVKVTHCPDNVVAQVTSVGKNKYRLTVKDRSTGERFDDIDLTLTTPQEACSLVRVDLAIGIDGAEVHRLGAWLFEVKIRPTKKLPGREIVPIKFTTNYQRPVSDH